MSDSVTIVLNVQSDAATPLLARDPLCARLNRTHFFVAVCVACTTSGLALFAWILYASDFYRRVV